MIINNDFHLHSTFSPDSNIPLETIVKKAISLGLDSIAITDHFDAEKPVKNHPLHLDISNYTLSISEVKTKYQDEIEVLTGIELGLINNPEILKMYDEILNEYEFDFVIASFHKHSDFAWIDLSEYLSGRTDEEATFDYYNHIIDTLKIYKNFDVLGHINVIDRYVKEPLPFEKIKPYITEIFNIIIPSGKGIEINTSGAKHGIETTMPNKKIFELYVNMGGTIVTVGSDAHVENSVTKGFKDAEILLENTGIEKISKFVKRELFK